jgi:hypothetical protein
VIKLLLLTLVLFSSLVANKVIYLNYEEIPHRVVKGEIFPVTIKSLSTVKDFEDIKYTFSNAVGLKVLDITPIREKKGKYYYDTFHFLSTEKWARLPDVEASLISSQEFNISKISGEDLNIITLNPKKNFSNIIADSLTLQEYKTTNYDNKHNIVIFIASAYNSDISAMRFKNVYKQGSESIKESYLDSKITYFVVVDKKIENFTFSYFNLLTNSFAELNIPIVVDDDSVTTQSDLKPKDQSHERVKMSIAAGIALLTFVFILFRRKYVYLIFLLLPLAYIGYLAIPEQQICIKKGAKIHLLPVENGTIFETTTSELNLFKEGKTKGFVKVKLENEKIGWIRNEDICTY